MDDAEPRTAAAKRRRKRKPSTGRERGDLDRRVLVLVKSAEDEELACAAAERTGARLRFAKDVSEFAEAVAAGAGAAVLADEMLEAGLGELRRILDRQSKWSELPVIVLFEENAPAAVLDALEEFELHARVKVTLLHRPVPVLALASAFRSALKSRLRQYEVRDLLARLNKDVRLRDQYLAMLGHELRNPLSSIGYVAEIFAMSGDALTREQARWGTEVIGRQLKQLSRLLDQLLDVARVQRGKIRIEAEHVDLRAVARRCAESFDALAKRRDFVLSVPARPVLVRGDPVRLTQIVENLLDNAYKYTANGGRIRLRITADRDAVLTVADDGYGIERSAVPHVFEPFYQEPRKRTQGSQGLGLGLAMVENLTRLHGGRALARSDGRGEGSEFELHIPLARSAAEDKTCSAHSRALRMLVIEDDADSADALALLLRSLGHEPCVAYDGTSGIDLLDKRGFDLVIVDLGLPDIDGKEVARRVRRKLGSDAPMLVALTGHVEGDGEIFDEFLLKPIGREQVERLCNRLS